jgi:hypothetical protein
MPKRCPFFYETFNAANVVSFYVVNLWKTVVLDKLSREQGDQIGRKFAQWVIVYFEQLGTWKLEMYST